MQPQIAGTIADRFKRIPWASDDLGSLNGEVRRVSGEPLSIARMLKVSAMERDPSRPQHGENNPC